MRDPNYRPPGRAAGACGRRGRRSRRTSRATRRRSPPPSARASSRSCAPGRSATTRPRWPSSTRPSTATASRGRPRGCAPRARPIASSTAGLRLDPEARNLRHTHVEPSPRTGASWRVQQMLVDTEGLNDWVAELDVDLAASREAGRAGGPAAAAGQPGLAAPSTRGTVPRRPRRGRRGVRMGKRPGLTRRELIQGVAGGLAVSAAGVAAKGLAAPAWDTIVVGAGVFGAWTAWHLRALGQRVLLLDASGPANARASSGGESRMTRTIYGADDVYTRMAWDSLEDWRWLSSRAGLPILHPIGVLMFFGKREPFVDQSLEAHRRLRPAPRRARPRGAAAALSAGGLGRRRGGTVRAGAGRPHGPARRADARPGARRCGRRVSAGGGAAARATAPTPRRRDAPTAGETLRAGRYVFACGPWLPKLFPSLLGTRIFPTRQEVFFFAPPRTATTASSRARLPGLGGLQRRRHLLRLPRPRGPRLQDRARRARRRASTPTPATGSPRAAGLGDVRAYLARRFPALAARPLVGVARLPVREQLERRPPHRPPPALAERAAGRRRIRPRLQARPRRRPLRRRPPDRPAGQGRAAFQPGQQGRGPAPRGALTPALTQRRASPTRRRLDKVRPLDRRESELRTRRLSWFPSAAGS